MATYYSIVNGYYNPIGIAPSTVTSAVTYNGINHTPSSGTASYTLSNGMTLSVIESNVWLEFGSVSTLIATNATNITTNTTAIAAINAALAALKTSSLQYNGSVKTGGAPPNPTYSMTADEVLNAILIAIWNEFTAVYTAISGASTGVSLATLNATLVKFVSDFTVGLNNSINTLLVSTISSGTASIGGQNVIYIGGAINISATQDNYIYLKNDSTLVYKHVNNGEPQPSTDAGTIVLWKIVTDGTHAISTADLRNIYPFTTSQIKNLYANNTIPFASRITAQWANFLLPATTTSDKILVSNGTGYAEGVVVTVDEVFNQRVGINQATPNSTLDVNGSINIGNDSTSGAGVMSFFAGDYYGDDGAENLVLARRLDDFNDVTLTSLVVNQVLYSDGSGWANKPSGFTSVTTTSAPTYIVLVTDCKIIGNNASTAQTITLPAANTVTGQTFDISASSSLVTHNVTINAISGNIKGQASKTMSTDGFAAHLWSDGANFYGIIG